MIDEVKDRLKETNAETREFLEDFIEKLKEDVNRTLDLEFIAFFLQEFSYEDLTEV